MTVTLKTNYSKSFPVLAVWKIGDNYYGSAYSTKEEAVNHLTGRFGDVKIIDETKEGS